MQCDFEEISYVDIKDSSELIDDVDIIINTTPIGMYPNVIGIPNLKPCTNFSFLVIQNTSIK